MADIYHEVEEEIRKEKLKKFWDQYGLWIIGAALAVIVIVAGWRGLKWYEEKRAGEFGAAFEAAMQLSLDGKPKEAEAAFSRLAVEATTGYRILTRFRAAAEAARTNPQAGLGLYGALANDRGIGPLLQDFARLRAAYLLVDSDAYEEMFKRLEGLTAKDNIWRHHARELLALSAWRTNNLPLTQKWIDQVILDAQTPAGVRARIDVLQAVIGPNITASG